jgi:lysophospholipase L1-like esterase
MTRSDPGNVYRDACTIVVAYMARDNSFAGPLMGLLQDSTQYAGFRLGGNQPIPNTSAGLFVSGLLLAPGKLNVLAITYTPTTVTVKLDADGVVTTATTSVTTAHTLLGSWNLGVDGTTYLYGSVTQAMVFNSALSGADRDLAMAFAKAFPAPQAWPDDRVEIAWVGNSITRSTACDYAQSFPFLTLAAVRAAGYTNAENNNVAVGGTGVNKLVDPINGALPPNSNNLFQRAQTSYSATRIKNVMVIALGTNNLAAGDNDVEFILHGTGSLAATFPGSGLYPAIDAAVAQGWKVVVVTPGPRTDCDPGYQPTYNSRRTEVCNDLVANGPSHGALVVDTRGIANFGGPTDSNNTTYYSADKIHPNNAGHALLAPSVTAAVLAALAA